MKKLVPCAAVVLALASVANAESTMPTSWDRVPSARSLSSCGEGFYIGFQGGFEIQQTTPLAELDREIGDGGGFKAGYVFGTGTFRPTVEADLLSNASRSVSPDIYDDIYGRFGREVTTSSVALLANFLLRVDLGQFQPYLGMGVGGYWLDGEAQDMWSDWHSSCSGFAWQAVGGADFYLDPTWSLFTEYKFLNYHDAVIGSDFDTGEKPHGRDFRQHLVMVGVRLHF